ncbi:Concanavalin A-like lectin/glucanase, subgroup [Artemisia annua]|uniref:Concanavalin A-like lectin/glucanase, subgroup n=1 Tax=Artemisia annua TaxID=35608 RepID=A0A2U1PWE2_ARTAN|nr:Concanavalin A-like lectin/glucanase, subgroup [Artemisia annua]
MFCLPGLKERVIRLGALVLGYLLSSTAKSRKAQVALNPKRVTYYHPRPRAGRHKLPCTPRGLPIIIHGQEPEGTSCPAPQEGCLLSSTAKSRKAQVALHPKRVAYCHPRPRAGRYKLPCTPRGLPIIIDGQEPEGTSCLAPQEGCLLSSTAKSRKVQDARTTKTLDEFRILIKVKYRKVRAVLTAKSQHTATNKDRTHTRLYINNIVIDNLSKFSAIQTCFNKMAKSTESLLSFIVLSIISLLVSRSDGDARSQVIKRYCDRELQNNQTIFVPNFVRTAEIAGREIQTSHNATVVVGTGPNRIYGLAQCYGDLSVQDCILCYASIRNSLPHCFPQNGGRIYLDGCYMRFQNYSFFEQYTGPNDTIVCGNTTRESGIFQDSTSQAVMNVVTGALRNSGYFAREEMIVSGTNKSVYVMAECWRTLSQDSCRACLVNASATILRCLPWSEGRALNTGCFMRYSDTNFLNPVPVISSSSNKGRIIAIVISVVSSLAVLAVALMIVLSIRNRRYIQQKRKGSYDVEIMAKILTNSSLNFKYATVQKATGNWDESNKLGQGGFGTVYKVQNNLIDVQMGLSGLLRSLELMIHMTDGVKQLWSLQEDNIACTNSPLRVLTMVTFTFSLWSRTCNVSKWVVHWFLTHPKWAWKYFKKGTVEELFDPNLMMHTYPNIIFQKDAVRVMHVGLLCIQEAPSLRPSMSRALKMLAKDDEPLPAPSNPPFIDEKTMELNSVTQKLLHYSNGDDSNSVATISHSHFFPR